MSAVKGSVTRVCMISFYYHPSYSGSAVQATNLSRHLREHGVESFIVSANLTGSTPTDRVEGFSVYRLPACKAQDLQIPSFWMSLAWFLFRHRKHYDVIHAHGTFQHAIASLMGRWLRKPTVLKIAMGNSDLAFDRHGRTWGRISRFLVNRFDRYVATSVEIHQECLERGLDSSRIRTIPNGVDTDVFFPAKSAQEKTLLRRRLGLPDVPTVCYVGVIDARKNLDGILRVWKRVRDASAEGRLLLIGPRPRGEEQEPGKFHNELLRFIEDNRLAESVTLTGPQRDVPDLLRCSDIFIFPSRREGMPNALLEAAASGLACVASRIGGSVDIIRHGESGYLFDVDDEAGMADAVIRLLGDPAHTALISTAARQRIMDVYSLRVIAQRYVELYRELLQVSLPRGPD